MFNFLEKIPQLSASEKKNFKLYFNRNSLNLSRLAVSVISIASFGFLYLDYLSAPKHYTIFWTMRIPMIILGIFILIFSFSKNFIKHQQFFLVGYNFIYKFIVLIMIFISSPDEMSYSSYFIGLIILSITVIALRLRIEMALIDVSVAYFIYILIAVFKQNLLEADNLLIFINNMFFLISSWIAIWTALYVLEISMRKTFLHEKELVEKNLEINQQKEEIKAQRDHEKLQKEKIEAQNKQITASIKYAQRLQNALLPKKINLDKYFDNFLINLPRDIVSGDFYWFKEVKPDVMAIAVADCTGHGVPGAFVSMLGISLLQEFFSDDMITTPHIVLNLARKRIKLIFQQSIEDKQQDGMDIALAVIHRNLNKLYFAGANRPLYICRNNNDFAVENEKDVRLYECNAQKRIIEIKSDKMPVGVFVRENSFTTKEFDLKDDDLLYMFSDGYRDQFTPQKKQLKSSQLKQMLCEISDLPLEEQREFLLKSFYNRKADFPQTDDVLFIGLKYKITT